MVELNRIFDQYSNLTNQVGEIANRGYAVADAKPAKVCFVGINPSYGQDAEFARFSYDPIAAVDGYKQYFGSYASLAEMANIPNDWTYLDALQLRETDQKAVIGLLKQDGGVDFIVEQLRFFHHQLTVVNPEVVVVCNAFVANFIGLNILTNGSNCWLGYNLMFDDQFGLYRSNGYSSNSIIAAVKQSNSTPSFIFTGFLKYMDRGTKETIAWLIRKNVSY